MYFSHVTILFEEEIINALKIELIYSSHAANIYNQPPANIFNEFVITIYAWNDSSIKETLHSTFLGESFYQEVQHDSHMDFMDFILAY